MDPISAIIALLILTLIAYGLLEAEPTATQKVTSSTDGDNVTLNTRSVPVIPQHVTSDPSTWPTGDRIWDIARAIAIAEGYNVDGSNPSRLNNPGDISDGAATYGSEFHSGSNVTKFPDAITGWTWLYAKLKNIATGGSSVYSPSMSWSEIASHWAANSDVWASNVSNALGVDVNSSFNDYVNG